MVPVARRNLFAEKGRFAISVGGVTFAVLLILVILGLYRGFEREAGSVVESVPADIWVMEQDTTDIFHSFSVISDENVSAVRAVPGVDGVIAVYARRAEAAYAGGSADSYLLALDLPAGTEALPGVQAPREGEIVIDEVFARKTGLRVGDTVAIRERDLTIIRVADISNIGLSQFSLISATDARDVIAIPGSVNFVLASVVPGSDPGAVAQVIEESVTGVRAETKADFAEDNRNEIMTFFLPIVSVLLVIAFLVGIVVIGLTIYTSTIERAREFAVMKAVGAGPVFLYRVVFSQSIILGVAGFLLGLPLALAVNRVAENVVPEFVNILRWQDLAAVFLVTLVMTIIAGLVPVRRVNSIDPASVFRA